MSNSYSRRSTDTFYHSAVVSDYDDDGDDDDDDDEYYSTAASYRPIPAAITTARGSNYPGTVSSSLSTVSARTPVRSNVQSQNNPSPAERVRIVGGTYKGKMGTFVKRTPQKIAVNIDGVTPPTPRYLDICNVEVIRNSNSSSGSSSGHHNNRSTMTHPRPTEKSLARPATAVTIPSRASSRTAPVALEVGRAVHVIGGSYCGKYGIIQKVTPQKVAVVFDNDVTRLSHYLLQKNVQMLSSSSSSSSQTRSVTTQGSPSLSTASTRRTTAATSRPPSSSTRSYPVPNVGR